MDEEDDSRSAKVNVQVRAGEFKLPHGASTYKARVFSELSPQKKKYTLFLLHPL